MGQATDYGLVSIITPNYNCERFIAETIESVQAQSYQNWEMLIQDDCSKDNSVAIALRYAENDSRIKVEVNPVNSGAAVTRNNALKRAKGKWMAFLDSDDLWYPEKLTKQLKYMVDNSYHFTYTSRDRVDENSHPLNIYSTGPEHVGRFFMNCYCWVGCLSSIYNSEVTGLIQVADIKRRNDYAMWLKVIKKTDCYLLKETLATYRVRNKSLSHSGLWKLVKSHYILFRVAEGHNPITSIFYVCLNLIFGTYKKIFYVHKIRT